MKQRHSFHFLFFDYKRANRLLQFAVPAILPTKMEVLKVPKKFRWTNRIVLERGCSTHRVRNELFGERCVCAVAVAVFGRKCGINRNFISRWHGSRLILHTPKYGNDRCALSVFFFYSAEVRSHASVQRHQKSGFTVCGFLHLSEFVNFLSAIYVFF